jgi:hypothetical protein
MKSSQNSPLVRGKPRFIARFMRLFLLYLLGNAVLLISMFLLIPVLSDVLIMLYSLFVLTYVFGCQILLARWLRGYDLSYMRYNGMLEGRDQVPCPNCMYPLFSPREVHVEHLCAECGCSIGGRDALRAWSRVRRIRVPGWWLKSIQED